MEYTELVKSLRFVAENKSTTTPVLLTDAADAIEELQGQIDGWIEQERKALIKSSPRWISVNEPPNDERNVFICYGRPDFKTVCIGYYDHTNKLFYEDRNWFATILYDPLFWCEMPKLPVEEQP